MAEKAIQAGRALVEAKGLVPHGEWLPFLKEAGISERQAQRYMVLARSGLKPDTVSDLGGFKAALEYLSTRQLPAAGEYLVAMLPDLPSWKEPLVAIWECETAPGHYHLFRVPYEETQDCEWTRRPVKPEGVWPTLHRWVDDRVSELSFAKMAIADVPGATGFMIAMMVEDRP